MGLSLKVDVYRYRLVRFHHDKLVIRGTKRKRLSGHLPFRWLGSHKSLQRERISKHSWLTRPSIGRDRRGGFMSSQCCLSLPHLSHLWKKRTIMSVMTKNTTTRTRLIHANMPVLLGLSALLLVSSVRCSTLRIRSRITEGRFILNAFPLLFSRRRISHALLCIHLPLRGRWLLLRWLRRQGGLRCECRRSWHTRL